MRPFLCRCERPVFFRNSACLSCGAPLGYEPQLGAVKPLTPGQGNEGWKIEGEPGVYRRCANLETPAGCNWLAPADSESPFCACCQLNRTVPNLSVPENAARWAKIELAKRRLAATLIQLRLPVKPWHSDEPGGLAFDFVSSLPGEPPPKTGHLNGIITVNVEEADDAKRESIRTAMHEPYRTLLGHLRHETGHYYWDRLIDGTAWIEEFRSLYGDERQDYASALQRHYNEGPALDWGTNFVSAYASSHPWEDWAETWAHYLHMTDAVDTAKGLGLRLDTIAMDFEYFTTQMIEAAPKDRAASKFINMCNNWLRLSSAMNELSRSMGHADYYPFVLSAATIRKLYFIDKVVAAD